MTLNIIKTTPALDKYAKGVHKLATSYSTARNARIGLIERREAAQADLNAMEPQERKKWEMRHLAKPIAKTFGSVPRPSKRGNGITFDTHDGKQCAQSIRAYADLSLSKEEFIEQEDEKSKTANERAKAARKKARELELAEEEDDSITIEGRPTVAQLRAIIAMCTLAQLERLLELVEEAQSKSEE